MDRMRYETILGRQANRRRLLLAGAAGLAAFSLPGRPTRLALAQATPEASPRAGGQTVPFFTLGVASGDPAPDGMVLWTRLAPSPVGGGGMDPVPYEVAWELASDEGFGTIVQRGTAVASPTFAHSVHVDVTGLEPAREYFYRFLLGDEVSAVGRTKTTPAAGSLADSLRFGFASCSNYEHGYFNAYRDMAAENFDLIIHLGDYIYEYGPNEYAVRDEGPLREHTGDEIESLVEYRNRFALYRTDPDLQAAHAAAPWLVTWDDHEVDNDYAADISEETVPVAGFLDRRAAAYQAYYEHMPLRPSSIPQGPDLQLYRRIPYGALAEFVVLDTRQYRTDQPCGDGVTVRCPAALDPATTMLGPAQEQWLLRQLDASAATWNVLAQQVMMAEMEQGEGDTPNYWGDSWSAYPEARNRILSHVMSRNISNPMVITGDIHTAWGIDLKADWSDEASATIGSEYICTSVTAGGVEPDTFFEAYLPEHPYIKYFNGQHGGYTAVEVTPDLWRADFRQVGNMLDAESAVETVATYVTEAGQPGVQPG